MDRPKPQGNSILLTLRTTIFQAGVRIGKGLSLDNALYFEWVSDITLGEPQTLTNSQVDRRQAFIQMLTYTESCIVAFRMGSPVAKL